MIWDTCHDNKYDNTSSTSIHFKYPVYTEQKLSRLRSGLQSGFRSAFATEKLYPFTRDMHSSIQQSASHCCSSFSHSYIANHITSGLKLCRSRSRSSVYTVQNFSIQISI